MSLMSSLYTGISGLQTSQSGINTTSHNLANLETKGYVKQDSIQRDNQYVNFQGNSYQLQQVGIGSSVAAIRQLRDEFLDKAYRQSVSRQGFYEEQYKAVSEVETFFGELDDYSGTIRTSFQSNIEDLWASLSELKKEPESIVTRSNFVNTAITFIEKASIISQQLNNYQVSLNTEIKENVGRINELGDKIHELNKQIARYESNGAERANDLRDQRNNFVDELSALVNTRYSEDLNGTLRINIEGQPFVTESNVEYITTVKESEGSNMLKVVWKNYPDVNLFNFDRLPTTESGLDTGSLKGLLMARGSTVSNYTDIPVKSDFSDESDYNNAKAHYNTYVDSSVIRSTQAQFDQLIHGIVTMINDVLCPNKQMDIYVDNGTGTMVSKTIWVLDTDIASMGMGLDNQVQGTELFSRKTMDRYTEIELKDASGTTLVDANGDPLKVYMYNEENPNSNHSLYTLGELEVNPDIIKNYSLLPLSNSIGSDEYDIKVIDKLLDKWQEDFATVDPNELDMCNFEEYYTNLISGLSNRGKALHTISSSQETLAQSIDNKKQEKMGVASDEELTNLIKFQHAYNAASRYVNVVSEMLEHLVMRLS